MKKRPIEEAQDELKALASTIPQATEPTASIIDGIVARLEAHKAEISMLLVSNLHKLPFRFF